MNMIEQNMSLPEEDVLQICAKAGVDPDIR